MIGLLDWMIAGQNARQDAEKRKRRETDFLPPLIDPPEAPEPQQGLLDRLSVDKTRAELMELPRQVGRFASNIPTGVAHLPFDMTGGMMDLVNMGANALVPGQPFSMDNRSRMIQWAADRGLTPPEPTGADLPGYLAGGFLSPYAWQKAGQGLGRGADFMVDYLSQHRTPLAGTPYSQRGIIGPAKDDDMLSIAKEAEEAGLPYDKIRDATGLERDAGGQWVEEIDDSLAAFTKKKPTGSDLIGGVEEPYYSGRLGEILSHDKLYERIPEMADVQVRISTKPGRQVTTGEYVPPTSINPMGTIHVWTDSIDNVDAIKAAIHESQHGVQEYFNMARGGASSEFTYARSNRLSNEANDLLGLANSDVAQQIEAARGDAKKIMAIRNGNPEEYGMIVDALNKYNLNNIQQMRGVAHTLYAQSDAATPYQQYLNMAGEAQARDAAFRMGMKPDERRMLSTIETERMAGTVPREQQTVRFNRPLVSSQEDEATRKVDAVKRQLFRADAGNYFANLEPGSRLRFSPDAIDEFADTNQAMAQNLRADGKAARNRFMEYVNGGGEVTYISTHEKTGMPFVMVTDPTPGSTKAEYMVVDRKFLEPFDLVDSTKRPSRPHQAKFPQYAEEYPKVPRRQKKVDPKTGKVFYGRGSTKETEAFSKERARIQKEIEKGDYEPYFDPEARFDAPSERYPMVADTRVEGWPKKPETIAKWRAKIQTDEARERLQAAYDAGVEAGYHDRWYMMGQLEEEFIKELGPEAGAAAFRERFSDAMAATTGGADPTSNLITAAYGNYMKTHGIPVPETAAHAPVPTKGLYLAGNLKLHDQFINQGRVLGIGHPKRHNFAANFGGHREVSTIDEQMTDLITPGLKAPPNNTYGIYEELVAEMATKNGVAPRDFQDIAWGGKKLMKGQGYTGKPMIQHVNDAIERTHRLTGMPREEILKRGIIRGEIPVYGLAGLGVLSMDDVDEREEVMQWSTLH